MPALRNIREANGIVSADFTAPDGREGCVSIPAAEYQAHGEAALEREAEACCAQAALHGYRPPAHDRYAELR